MNSRLQQMIERGTLPQVDGQWIDTYNQSTDPDCAGTIIAGINAKNHYYTMEVEPINATEDGLATTLTTAHHYAGNIVAPKRGQTEMGVRVALQVDIEVFEETDESGKKRHYIMREGKRVSVFYQDGKVFRIRKLTPRECFRLMDVDDRDIDKIQAAGISNSQQYKMAGNSIVVSCLYHIFDKLFINNQITNKTLFDL